MDDKWLGCSKTVTKRQEALQCDSFEKSFVYRIILCMYGYEIKFQYILISDNKSLCAASSYYIIYKEFCWRETSMGRNLRGAKPPDTDS